MQNKIYSRQLGALILIGLLGSSFIYVPESSITGHDVWIATILASLVGLYVLYAILFIQSRFPGHNLMEISEMTLGSLAGKLLNFFYLFALLMVAIFYLFDMIIFLNLIFPLMSRYLLQVIIITIAAYMPYKGPAIIARMADLFIWIVVLFAVLGLAITAPLGHLSQVLPILADWKPILVATIYGANWPFGEIVVFAMLLPLVIDLDKRKERIKIYQWYTIAAVFLVMRSFITLAVLGSEQLIASRFPLYFVFRLVQLSNFQRMELFFFILFFIITFGAVVISYQCLTLGLSTIFNLKSYKTLIFPTAAIIVVLTSYMLPSDLFYLFTVSPTIKFITLPIYILYPTIILIAARLRRVSHKPRSQQLEL